MIRNFKSFVSISLFHSKLIFIFVFNYKTAQPVRFNFIISFKVNICICFQLQNSSTGSVQIKRKNQKKLGQALITPIKWLQTLLHSSYYYIILYIFQVWTIRSNFKSEFLNFMYYIYYIFICEMLLDLLKYFIFLLI